MNLLFSCLQGEKKKIRKPLVAFEHNLSYFFPNMLFESVALYQENRFLRFEIKLPALAFSFVSTGARADASVGGENTLPKLPLEEIMIRQ